MKIKPIGDRIILKPISQEETTKSGIILPQTVDKEKPEQGEVIAVGPGKTLDNGQIAPLSVKKGDKVIFTKYGPTEIKVDKKEYLVVKEEDILAVLE